MGYLDKKVALQYLANSEALFAKFKKRFLENHANTVTELTDYIAENNTMEIYNIIHQIKGISLYVGSQVLYDDAEIVLGKIKEEKNYLPSLEIFINTFRCVYDELLRL